MRAGRPTCAFVLSLLACQLPALTAESDACESENGTCAADVSKDTTAMLQHPKKRAVKEQHAARRGLYFVARDGEVGGKPKHHRRKRRAFVPEWKARHASEMNCRELGQIIGRHPTVSFVLSFWRYICHEDVRRFFHEVKDACLYLPDNHHVKTYFEKVESPNPWHFVDMMEDSIFPQQDGKCPTGDGKPDGPYSSLTGEEFHTCGGGTGWVGSHGDCLKVTLLEHAEGPNIKVFALNGMMGLDYIWERMMQDAGDNETATGEALTQKRRTLSDEVLAIDRYKNLTDYPEATIPIEVHVCDDGSGEVFGSVTDQKIHDQLDVLNRAYAGGDRCRGHLAYDPKYTDTKLRFTLKGIIRETHHLCAYDCTENIEQLNREVIPRENGIIKVLLCPTDLLGIASFPGDPDTKRSLIVNPESMPGGRIDKYNEGDTLVHESGHYLGLFHTFQGGCGAGDRVKDTKGESSPNYGCPVGHVQPSCAGPGPDPVHDFMDYSDDSCMCSFTPGQVHRIHVQLKEFQPDLLRNHR